MTMGQQAGGQPVFQMQQPTMPGFGGGADAAIAQQKLMVKRLGQINNQFQKKVPPMERMFKKLGLDVSLKGLLKQSQIFTGTLGAIFQILGAFIDVTLAPMIPLVVPAIRKMVKAIPMFKKLGEKIRDFLVGFNKGLKKLIPDFMKGMSPILTIIISWLAIIALKSGLGMGGRASGRAAKGLTKAGIRTATRGKFFAKGADAAAPTVGRLSQNFTPTVAKTLTSNATAQTGFLRTLTSRNWRKSLTIGALGTTGLATSGFGGGGRAGEGGSSKVPDGLDGSKWKWADILKPSWWKWPPMPSWWKNPFGGGPDGKPPPGDGKPPPGDGKPPPGDGKPPPGNGKPPPSVEKPPPVVEKPPPVVEKPPPVVEKPPPVVEKPPPVDGGGPGSRGLWGLDEFLPFNIRSPGGSIGKGRGKGGGADVKPADVKPADVKPADVKPVELKPYKYDGKRFATMEEVHKYIADQANTAKHGGSGVHEVDKPDKPFSHDGKRFATIEAVTAYISEKSAAVKERVLKNAGELQVKMDAEFQKRWNAAKDVANSAYEAGRQKVIDAQLTADNKYNADMEKANQVSAESQTKLEDAKRNAMYNNLRAEEKAAAEKAAIEANNEKVRAAAQAETTAKNLKEAAKTKLVGEGPLLPGQTRDVVANKLKEASKTKLVGEGPLLPGQTRDVAANKKIYEAAKSQSEIERLANAETSEKPKKSRFGWIKNNPVSNAISDGFKAVADLPGVRPTAKVVGKVAKVAGMGLNIADLGMDTYGNWKDTREMIRQVEDKTGQSVSLWKQVQVHSLDVMNVMKDAAIVAADIGVAVAGVSIAVPTLGTGVVAAGATFAAIQVADDAANVWSTKKKREMLAVDAINEETGKMDRFKPDARHGDYGQTWAEAARLAEPAGKGLGFLNIPGGGLIEAAGKYVSGTMFKDEGRGGQWESEKNKAHIDALDKNTEAIEKAANQSTGGGDFSGYAYNNPDKQLGFMGGGGW